MYICNRIVYIGYINNYLAEVVRFSKPQKQSQYHQKKMIIN